MMTALSETVARLAPPALRRAWAAKSDFPSGWWLPVAAAIGLAFWIGLFWVILT